jgi:hypothetical protein
MQLIDTQTFTPQTVNIPDNCTMAEWMDLHRAILTCKRAAGKWLSQSRAYAVGKWGNEWTADAEAQLELDLGFAITEDKPALNPADKTKAIVTIEGLSQKFEMWERKMHDEIDQWDKPRLERALELLTPMEATAARIRQLLT